MRLSAESLSPKALPYATRAASTQNEFAAISWDLVGRMRLALGQYQEADKAFGMAIGRWPAAVRGWALADTLQRRDGSASGQARWPKPARTSVRGISTGVASTWTRQWDWPSRSPQGADDGCALEPAGSAQGAVPAIRWRVAECDTWQMASAADHCPSWRWQTLEPRRATDVRDAHDASPMTPDSCAQRMGQCASQAKAIRAIGETTAERFDVAAESVVARGSWQASELCRRAHAQQSDCRAGSMLDGNEPFQTHVALLEAYAAARPATKALAEARWLTAHRGRAYIEFGGCTWCQQALNVTDTTMAHLRAAELLANSRATSKRTRELASFDRNWPAGELPDHLRVRRDRAGRRRSTESAACASSAVR